MAVNSFNAQNPPVTTKGDLFTFSTIPTRLGVGANNTVLTADSTAATGLKWATPSSGGMTSLATGSLSGSTVSISGISGDYIHLELVLTDLYPSVDANLTATLNNDSGSKYVWGSSFNNSGNSFGTVMRLTAPADNSDRNNYVNIQIPNYTNSLRKIIGSRFILGNDVTATDVNYGQYWGGADITAAITRIDLSWTNSATFSGGTYTLYGVK